MHDAIVKPVTTTVLLLLALAPALARDRAWYRYENAYFEAYSDAPEAKALALLEDLELFRGAVLMVSGAKVPDNAMQTQVVIFNSTRDFRKTITSQNTAAYMTSVTGVPYMVLPARNYKGDTKHFIRHEYTHVLQAYNPTKSPPWYIEGFAEFMSGLEVDKDKNLMLIGGYNGRVKSSSDFVDWDRLIEDSFNFKILSRNKGSDAYLQSWLLVHYLSIGDDYAHNEDLNRYLIEVARGMPSSEAFQRIFNELPSEMGPRIYRQYTRRFIMKQLQFTPQWRDLDFKRTEADPGTVARIIESLKIRNGVPSD